MGTEIASEREKIYVEDVQGGASVSESVGSKIGASVNFILDKIVQQLVFGVGGSRSYSGLTVPYTFTNNSEVAVEDYLIQRVSVSNALAGTAGTTTFKIEKRPFGSLVWTSIFSTNCSIGAGAADNLVFNSDDVSAPAGVTLPVLNTTSIGKGDELRFILISARTGGTNLKVNLEVSPI